jgi:hypothetical protein
MRSPSGKFRTRGNALFFRRSGDHKQAGLRRVGGEDPDRWHEGTPVGRAPGPVSSMTHPPSPTPRRKRAGASGGGVGDNYLDCVNFAPASPPVLRYPTTYLERRRHAGLQPRGCRPLRSRRQAHDLENSPFPHSPQRATNFAGGVHDAADCGRANRKPSLRLGRGAGVAARPPRPRLRVPRRRGPRDRGRGGGRPHPILPAYRDVCRSADGHLQATGRDARGRKQYRYHLAGVQSVTPTSSCAWGSSDGRCRASAAASPPS